jgi:two-component system cell cycle response regulator
MNSKTRVFLVRVVGFSAPERQMLNSIFLLSVAPARQIGYKLWNPETGTAPDMYLLDGDSDSAVASWQTTFASTADRTLVVGAKNTDLGVASAARPLGLKVVGAMDRLAIALNNVANAAKEPAGLDVSEPRAGGTLPTSPPVKGDAGFQRTVAGLSQSLNTGAASSHGATIGASLTANATPSAAAATMTATQAGATVVAAASAATAATSAAAATSTPAAAAAPMTANAPAATVLPHVTLQPNVAPMARDGAAPSFEKTINEKPVTDKTVDRILTDKPERIFDKMVEEKSAEKPAEKSSIAPTSGATPLSPAALAAVVAPTPRPSLRVVPTTSPLSASLPSAAAAAARIAEQPMTPPPAAPVAPPVATAPVTPAPVVPVPAPVAPVAPAAAMTRHEEHSFRVLAVDDSPLMRTFLQNKLQPYGIHPEFASSGEEALFKISKQHFDLIFLDVMLPGMDGYDVCKMIKKNKDNALMKVIMLTSKDKTFDKIRGTMAGCDNYLTKPVDEMKLRAIIERHTVAKK